MSRDDMHDLALGAAFVILGYALYKHFKPAQAVTTSSPAMAVENNWTTTSPGSIFTSLTDLLSGTVHDIGGYQGQNYLAQIEGDYSQVKMKTGLW